MNPHHGYIESHKSEEREENQQRVALEMPGFCQGGQRAAVPPMLQRYVIRFVIRGCINSNTSQNSQRKFTLSVRAASSFAEVSIEATSNVCVAEKSECLIILTALVYFYIEDRVQFSAVATVISERYLCSIQAVFRNCSPFFWLLQSCYSTSKAIQYFSTICCLFCRHGAH